MQKKKIINYLAFFLILLLMFVLEKNTGIYAFAIGFFMALVYCRQNAIILCVFYAVGSMALNFELFNLIYALFPCIVVITAYFIHYKLKKKITQVMICVYTFIACLPLIVFKTADVYQIVNTIISILTAQMFLYACKTYLQPALTRGFDARLRHDEKLSGGILLTAIFAGLSFVTILDFSVYLMVSTLVLLFLRQLKPSLALSVAGLTGLGGSVAQISFYYIAVLISLAMIVVAFKEKNIYISAVATLMGAFIFNYFFGKGWDWVALLPFAAGCFVACCFPPKVFLTIRALEGGTNRELGLRTLINRDRKNLSNRLNTLSRVFYEIEDILSCETRDKNSRYSGQLLTREVVDKLCKNCFNYEKCKETMGEPSFVISSLVQSAMDNNKVTILDVPPVITNNCKKINTLLSFINDLVKKSRQRMQIEKSVEKGREMIIAQMRGMGLLLNQLSQDMHTQIKYDTVLEKEIFEELSRMGIAASDIVVYGKEQRPDRITVIIKEAEAHPERIRIILSEFLGVKMLESLRETSIKGNITLHFTPAPPFDLVYGEKTKAYGDKSGDNTKAIRLSQDKLMLILVDGMGRGKQAYDTSMNAILMIESFYKAGFDHNTILSCVGGLLNLREEEDFNALDIVVFDISKGIADFIKQGGRESFILSNGNVEIIESGSLPLGIIDEAVPIIEQRKLKKDDIILLVSDGVADSLGTDMIKDILLSSNTKNPQVFAELIVNNADRMAKEKSRDDMSCIAARIV